MRIVVVGGGYAGLGCLLSLARRLPESERHLVDPAEAHLARTRLHEGLQRPREALRVPFAELAERHGFRWHRARARLGRDALAEAARVGRLRLGEDGELGFDLLVLAMGARPAAHPRRRDCYGVAELAAMDGRRLVAGIAEEAGSRDTLVVAGGGATGLQFLFEARDALRRAGARCRLRLVDAGPCLLPGLPRAFHDYVTRRLGESGIAYEPNTRLAGFADGRLRLAGPRGGTRERAGRWVLCFPGIAGNPAFLATDGHGRVRLAGRTLDKVLAAGDCARYESGFDRPSAQAAVRQGRHLSRVIAARAAERRLPRYRARELGFFLAMGTLDGIGWMGRRANVVTGLPAFAVREAIEARQRLLVAGLDTYRVL